MSDLRLPLTLLVVGSMAGWLAANQQDWGGNVTPPKVANGDGAAGATLPLDSMSFVRGVEVPVASARSIDGSRPRTSMVDTYIDWDFGAVPYLGEDGSIAVMPAPKNWDFRHVQLPNGGGMVALCFQPGTGLTFLLDGNGEWSPIQESSTELVVGDYDVTLAIDVDRVFALRFDTFSGRSWSLEDNGWQPIAGNLQGWPPKAGEGR